MNNKPWDTPCDIVTLDDQGLRNTIQQHVRDGLQKLGYLDTKLLHEAAEAASLALSEDDIVGYASNFIKLTDEVKSPQLDLRAAALNFDY